MKVGTVSMTVICAPILLSILCRSLWTKKVKCEVDPLKSNFVSIIFKNLVRTARKAPRFLDKDQLLMTFKAMIAVYSDNYAKSIIENAEL